MFVLNTTHNRTALAHPCWGRDRVQKLKKKISQFHGKKMKTKTKQHFFVNILLKTRTINYSPMSF